MQQNVTKCQYMCQNENPYIRGAEWQIRDGKASVFLYEPETFEFLDCEMEIETPKQLCEKKTRLGDA